MLAEPVGAATVERFLDAVLDDGDLSCVRHYRLGAIADCRTLRGAPVLDVWRERITRYPDSLAVAVVEASLHPGRFPGWRAREALAERGDTIAVQPLLSAVARGVFVALLAVNRIFQPHPQAQWQEQTLTRLQRQPAGFRASPEEMWHTELQSALGYAEALVHDTLDLAEQLLGQPFTATRAALEERRRSVEPPPAN